VVGPGTGRDGGGARLEHGVTRVSVPPGLRWLRADGLLGGTSTWRKASEWTRAVWGIVERHHISCT
jgi:hypothetical protein